MDALKFAAIGFLAPLFWAVALGLLLWLTRLLFPRAENYLFGPIGNLRYLMGWLAGRLVRATRQAASSLRGYRQP